MATSSSSGEIKTPVFNGENYDFWRVKMKTIFISQDLWSLVEQGYPTPAEDEDLTVVQVQELKKNIKRDAVEEKEVDIVYCQTEDQIADIFTKALPKHRFIFLRELLGVKQQCT